MKHHIALSMLITGGLLFANAIVNASSPDAWQQYYQEITTKCLKSSGLNNPKPVGQVINFSQDVGYDALLIRGNYPQSHMNNQEGQFLCLFNQKTRQVYLSDANKLQSRDGATPGHTVQQVLNWASHHQFLRPLQAVKKLEQGDPDYRSIVSLGQKPNQSASYISFELCADATGIVTDQTIDYRDYGSFLRPLAFTRTDAEGLQLIRTIYGESIKNDFMRSRLVKTINEGEHFKMNIYVGEQFVYQTWNDQPSAQFKISRLEDLNRIAQR